MISPQQISDKSNKIFFKVVSQYLKSESAFPLCISGDKQFSGDIFSEMRSELLLLYQNSKLVKGKGYSIDWKKKKVQNLPQSIPQRIYYESIEDYLYFIKRETDFTAIIKSKNIVLNRFPLLEDWLNNNPDLLLKYCNEWADLIKVCSYFLENPPPHQFYIRDLPIEVHTKFIEKHTNVLKKVLDIILPNNWIVTTASDFADRYQLKKVSVYTQIRILDDKFKSQLGYNECSLTLEDAKWLDWVPQNVFIIENQICFHTFPKFENSVAIFGEGFKSRLTKEIPWLGKTNLYCWFDLDTAGFEMLNMIREHYPNAINLMMNWETYNAFQEYSVDVKSPQKTLPHLSDEESELYAFLATNNKRLEQERISQFFVQNILRGKIDLK